MNREIPKKPENYEPGGLKKIKKPLSDNIVGVVFMLSLIVWLITSLFVTISDIINGQFDHKVLSFSFIGGILTAGFLIISKQIRNKKLGIKTPKKKKSSCQKCGKNKTKN
jgi:uncharacterized membrane protein